MDVTANCIYEIRCLALDGFDLNTVHQLSNKEKKNLGGARIQTWGCWVGSKNASSVLCSPNEQMRLQNSLFSAVDASATAETSGKRRKKNKLIATHDQDRQRQRYFADDDKHDLKSMFEREKLSTAEDQNAMLSRLAWLLNFTIGATKKVLT